MSFKSTDVRHAAFGVAAPPSIGIQIDDPAAAITTFPDLLDARPLVAAAGPLPAGQYYLHITGEVNLPPAVIDVF